MAHSLFLLQAEPWLIPDVKKKKKKRSALFLIHKKHVCMYMCRHSINLVHKIDRPCIVSYNKTRKNYHLPLLSNGETFTSSDRITSKKKNHVWFFVLRISKLQFLAETDRRPLWFVRQVLGVTMQTNPRAIPLTFTTVWSRYKHTD